jgi:hypothetical protein
MKNGKLLIATMLALTILLGTAGSIARASITPPSGGWKWLGYAYHGFDSFHGANVYAYEYNSTAVLSVTVHNDYVTDKNLNISALKVWMDWGTNYTSTITTMSNPYVIPWHESRVIPIEFKVPSTDVVSNKAIYAYTIFLEYVNATTGPKKIIGWDKEFAGLDFVVYSNDQVEAQKTMIIVGEMFDTTNPDHFNSTKAKIWWIKAENETFVAEINYNRGDFESAKTHSQNALSMINQAFTAEEAKGGGFDDAQVDLLKAQAESLRASASYLTGLSNMWVLIGVAAVLFAIGYIIRGFGALRKPGAPAA